MQHEHEKKHAPKKAGYVTEGNDAIERLRRGYHLKQHREQASWTMRGGARSSTTRQRYSLIRPGTFDGKGDDAYDEIGVHLDLIPWLMGQVEPCPGRKDAWRLK